MSRGKIRLFVKYMVGTSTIAGDIVSPYFKANVVIAESAGFSREEYVNVILADKPDKI